MASGTTAPPSKAELRRQHTLERRKKTAADVLGTSGTEVVARPQSFAAQTISQALPREFLDQGLIAFRQEGRPVVAEYVPTLLAPNPQRGRLTDRGLDELAASLDIHGQQEPVIARLLTPSDRQRWPDAFRPDQILLILNGHRVFFAQPKSKLEKLRVEVMFPEEGESDTDYIRRGLRRASIKMMHSQSYDIFDKVNLYMVWRQEYALKAPNDKEVAKYFEISRTEAQRVKAVANLDEGVKKDILKQERRPADEVVFAIANRPVEEQRDAYREFGHLTVSALRRIQDRVSGPAAAKQLAVPGRPRNYTLSIGDEDCPIVSISTNLSPQQWKRRGGARSFWKEIKALSRKPELREHIQGDLGR